MLDLSRVLRSTLLRRAAGSTRGPEAHSNSRQVSRPHGVAAGPPDALLLPSLRPTGARSKLTLMSISVVSRDPEVMGGTAVFTGTRVPVQTLLDYLEAGESIDDFLAGFPSVKREQVIAFLEAATEQLVAASS
jgi:uncharacterized protein (DUF433 family)